MSSEANRLKQNYQCCRVWLAVLPNCDEMPVATALQHLVESIVCKVQQQREWECSILTVIKRMRSMH